MDDIADVIPQVKHNLLHEAMGSEREEAGGALRCVNRWEYTLDRGHGVQGVRCRAQGVERRV
jgi:hypothetical protein